MSVEVKICGIRSPTIMKTAVAAGASFVGLVFFENSPRAVTAELAAELIRLVPPDVRTVGVFVDPDDAYLEHVLDAAPLDMIQLHGRETPERIQNIKQIYNLPVIKALAVAEKADLARAALYTNSADWLLFDAKPPKNVIPALPGGLGIPFDWEILRGAKFPLPWMLSGGLNAENLAEAVTLTGAKFADVSSGVEDSPGNKNAQKIEAFLRCADTL